MNYKIRFIIPLFIFICSYTTNAQKVYVTKSGQTIILYSNGKWEYTQLNTSDQVSELFTNTNADVDPYEVPIENKYILTDQEEEMYANLTQQLLLLEVDYFVRYTIIKNRNNTERKGADKKLEKDLKSRYEKSSNLIKNLKNIKSSDIDDRQKILVNIKKQLKDDFKIEQKEERFKPKQVRQLMLHYPHLK